MNVAEGENNAPVMVNKTIITNGILYKASSQKLEEEYKEKRARKNKYHKDSRLFLTAIEGQIESTLFCLIKAQPGYKNAHRDGKLIECLKIIQNYCNGGGSNNLQYQPMYSVTMAGKFVGWEQRGKSTAKYQEDLKTKLTATKSTNGKFPLGTAHLTEVLRKKGMSYDNYEKLSKVNRKPYETQANNLLLACVFIRNCKQWGNDNMEALENLFSSLEETQVICPKNLGDAAEQYEMNYCKARKNRNSNRNSK